MAWWTRSKTPARDERSPVDPNMPLIRFEGITRTFKGDSAGEEAETVALDNVTVDIARGEYISISGPSGCGKSTML
jgi:ABC-type sugar transport system ATPase subunit